MRRWMTALVAATLLLVPGCVVDTEEDEAPTPNMVVDVETQGDMMDPDDCGLHELVPVQEVMDPSGVLEGLDMKGPREVVPFSQANQALQPEETPYELWAAGELTVTDLCEHYGICDFEMIPERAP
ncbi:MAG: hypothetical protein R3B72_04875 [Polyangiaceae bacterium]